MQIECSSCGASYDESADKCPSCDHEMDPKEKAEASAKAAFQAAMPPAGAPLLAARLNDPYICPLIKEDLSPHVGGMIKGPCIPNVLIAGAPAAVVGDITEGENCMTHAIAKGSATVLIMGRPAARLTDQTAHGGVITAGAPTVVIGG